MAALLPPLPNGVTELSFSQVMVTPIGPKGRELSPAAKQLVGKPVRLVGHMGRQMQPIPWAFLLSPVAQSLHEREYFLCDDLPANAVRVSLPKGPQPIVPYHSGLVAVTGHADRCRPGGIRRSGLSRAVDPHARRHQQPDLRDRLFPKRAHQCGRSHPLFRPEPDGTSNRQHTKTMIDMSLIQNRRLFAGAVALAATAALQAAPTVSRLTPPSMLFSFNDPGTPIMARFLPGQRFDLQATVSSDAGQTITSVAFKVDGNPVTNSVAFYPPRPPRLSRPAAALDPRLHQAARQPRGQQPLLFAPQNIINTC